MVAGAELHNSRAWFDSLTLYLGRGCEVVGADEVGGRLLLPSDLAGWLREGCQGLAREAVNRPLGRDLVAILQEEFPDHVGIDADGAVVARLQPRRWLSAD